MANYAVIYSVCSVILVIGCTCAASVPLQSANTSLTPELLAPKVPDEPTNVSTEKISTVLSPALASDNTTPTMPMTTLSTTLLPTPTTTEEPPTTTATPTSEPTTTSTVTPTPEPNTTSTVKPTPEPTTTSTVKPTPEPTTTKPTTVQPTTTSVAPSTTSTPASTTVAPSPRPSCRHFDAPSFIGGIVLSVGLMAIGFVAWKFYIARTGRNYHTL